jgi:hypothetical protein
MVLQPQRVATRQSPKTMYDTLSSVPPHVEWKLSKVILCLHNPAGPSNREYGEYAFVYSDARVLCCYPTSPSPD